MLNIWNQFWSLVFQRVTLLPLLSLTCHCLCSVQLDEWSSSDDVAKPSQALLFPQELLLFDWGQGSGNCLPHVAKSPFYALATEINSSLHTGYLYCWEHIFSQLIRRIVIKGFMRIDPRRSTHLCWSLLWQTWLFSTKVWCLPSQVPQSTCCWEVRCLPHGSSKGLRMRAFNASSSPTTSSCPHHIQS